MIHAELQATGIPCGRHRVARLMQQGGLRAKQARTFVVTTQSGHPHPVAPNLLPRRFAPAAWPVRDRGWVGDIMYIPAREGWIYSAVLLDLASRRVVGWACGATLARDLPLAALRMPLGLRRPLRGALHHSDRGSQPGLNWSPQHVKVKQTAGTDRVPRAQATAGTTPSWRASSRP